MYEHLAIETVLEHLSPEMRAELEEALPPVRSTHLTAKNALRDLDTNLISKLYIEALHINYASLAVLTVDILIKRDYGQNPRFNPKRGIVAKNVVKDVVVKELQSAFDNHKIIMGSNFVNVLGLDLFGRCIDYDYLLAKYGQELSRGLIFMGPEDWFRETLKHSKNPPSIAHEIPWTKALLND
jgi:hypothetical protein